MIKRYTLPEMQAVWSDENRFRIWLEIEILSAEAWSQLGEVPKEAIPVIRKKAAFNIDEIAKLEAVNNHEMIAFLENVQSAIGAEGRYLHFGLTSSDVMDTAVAVQLKEAGQIILKELDLLIAAVREKAMKYRGLVCVARTHGVHAEPTTFGLKLLVWLAELERQKKRLEEAIREVSVGKISGAVGTYSNVDPSVEEYICRKLGLTPEPVSTQIVQRDRHAQFLSALALLGGSLEKFAMEIRNLQRTEIGEAEEPFTKGQKGSSAMPHKRNPVLSERICGLARLLRGYALTGYENVALWHERDISHSSVERVSLADATILIHYMLRTFTKIVSGMQVYPDRMKQNLEYNGGIVYSSRLLLALVEKGLARKEAYEMAQSVAMKAFNEKLSFRDLVMKDAGIGAKMSKSELEKIFDPKWFVRHEDEVYARLGLIEPAKLA